MQFTHEHEELRRNLRRFIDDEINPHVDEWEVAEIFPAHEVFKNSAAGLPWPDQAGELRRRRARLVLLDGDGRTLGHVRCGGVPMAIGVHTDMATPALARFGSDELKRSSSRLDRRRLCRLPRRIRVGAAPTSPRSDHGAKDGGDYVINGGKMWITNGPQADWMCLLANTVEGTAHKNKTLICLPMKTKGVTLRRRSARSA